MVHVVCLDPECRRAIHLDDPSHWNYEGTIACPRCGATMTVMVRDGKLISFRAVHRGH